MKSSKKIRSTSSTSSAVNNGRLSFFGFGILAMFGLLVYKAFEIQVVNHDIYQAMAENQHRSEGTLRGVRGNIYVQDLKSDRLHPVAINKRLYTVTINPKQIQDKGLASIGYVEERLMYHFPEYDRERLKTQISKQGDMWELIERNVSQEKAEEMQAEDLVGVYYEEQTERFYPEETFASHVLGFVRSSDQEESGQYGVEQFYQEVLRGQDGYEQKETDTRGTWLAVSDRERVDPKEGSDLVLTIDHTIQFKLEETLAKLTEDFQAKGATGIIMDPYTGEILALANQPTFNPNEFNKVESLDVFLNRAVSAIYEPGSIFKPLTVAMGIDTESVTPETTYYDSGELTLNGFTIKNANERSFGQSTVQFALNNSLNTGMAFIQQKVGQESFKDYMNRFWFGQQTGVDLPGELAGNLNNIFGSRAVVRDINFATASYGQGIAVTPIQMLTAYNAIVSDGQVRKPHVVDEIRHKDGTVEDVEPEILGQAVSEQTVETLRNMMVDTVESGQSKKAGVPGYYIGGKTGTAQIPSPEGGYGDDTFQSFIEFGTLADTRFTMLISLDSPIGSRFADGSVVPAAREMNEFLVNYFDISPDYTDNSQEEPTEPENS